MFQIVPQLTVSHMGRAVEFYVERLRFSVTVKDPAEDPEFVALEREESSLFLVTDTSRDEDKRQDLQGNKRGVGTRLYFEVDDAEADYEALREAGVTIAKELTHNEQEDYTEFSILDPDGYEIGIYS